MRRLGRWTLNIFTALSLVLCLVTAALWVRSYRPVGGDLVADYHFEPRGGHWYEQYVGVTSNAGGLSFDVFLQHVPVTTYDDDLHGLHWVWEDTGQREYPALQSEFLRAPYPWVNWRERFQIYVQRSEEPLSQVGTTGQRYPYAAYFVVAPHWAWVTLTAITPMLWLAGKLRRVRLRRRPGLCPSCGYDLHATPGRCPECGHIAEATA